MPKPDEDQDDTEPTAVTKATRRGGDHADGAKGRPIEPDS
jgi:hypothetical protein